jgi:TolA-binding protein
MEKRDKLRRGCIKCMPTFIHDARKIYKERNNNFGSSSRKTSDVTYMLAVVEEKRGNFEKAR